MVVAAERLVPLGRRIPGAAEWLSIKRLVNHASIRPAYAVQRPPPRAPISGSQESKAVVHGDVGQAARPSRLFERPYAPLRSLRRTAHLQRALSATTSMRTDQTSRGRLPRAARLPIRRTTSGGSGNSWKRKTSRGR